MGIKLWRRVAAAGLSGTERTNLAIKAERRRKNKLARKARRTTRRRAH